MIAIVRPSVLFNALIVFLGFYYLLHLDLAPKAQSMAMMLIPAGSMALMYHLWIKPGIQNKSLIRLLSTVMFAVTTSLATAAALVHFDLFEPFKFWLLAAVVAVFAYEWFQFRRRGLFGNGSSTLK